MILSPSRFAALVAAFLLCACGDSSTKPGVPTGFTVTPADGAAIISWDEPAQYNYTLFSAMATSITRENYTSFPSSKILWPVSSPYVMTGLTNGQTYSFLLNARDGSGPAGEATASIAVTPKLRGDKWANGTATGANDNKSVVYGYSRFVTVTPGGHIYSCIFNGISSATSTACPTTAWKAETPPTASSSTPAPTLDLNGVTYNPNTTRFLAVGAAGTIVVGTVSTTDTAQITWTNHYYTTPASGVTLPTLNAVVASGTGYVAVGAGGTIVSAATTTVTNSYDTITWTVQKSGTDKDLYSIAYLNGEYIALGAGGTILTSPDAVTWTAQTSGVTADLHGIAYGTGSATGLYIIVGKGGTVLTSTAPGTTGTLNTFTRVAVSTSADLYSVAFGSQFVIAGAGQKVFTCNNTSTLSTDVTMSCDKAGSWVATSSAGPATLYKVIFAAGTYLAVGSAGSNQITVD